MQQPSQKAKTETTLTAHGRKFVFSLESIFNFPGGECSKKQRSWNKICLSLRQKKTKNINESKLDVRQNNNFFSESEQCKDRTRRIMLRRLLKDSERDENLISKLLHWNVCSPQLGGPKLSLFPALISKTYDNPLCCIVFCFSVLHFYQMKIERSGRRIKIILILISCAAGLSNPSANNYLEYELKWTRLYRVIMFLWKYLRIPFDFLLSKAFRVWRFN